MLTPPLTHGVLADSPCRDDAHSESDGAGLLGDVAGGRSDSEGRRTPIGTCHEPRRFEDTAFDEVQDLWCASAFESDAGCSEPDSGIERERLERELFGRSESESDRDVGQRDTVAQGSRDGAHAGQHLHALSLGERERGSQTGRLVDLLEAKQEDAGFFTRVSQLDVTVRIPTGRVN